MTFIPTPASQRFHTLQAWRHGASVRRYHAHHGVVGEQTVGQHVHGMLLLTYLLHPADHVPPTLLDALVFHDLAEARTGDVPASIKWKYPALATALEAAEQEAAADMRIPALPLHNPFDALWLAMVDKLELCCFAYEQRRLGNVTMEDVFDRGMHWLEEIIFHPCRGGASGPGLAMADEFAITLKQAMQSLRTGHRP